MVTRNSYRIANLAYGHSTMDCTYEFDFRGNHFEVQRFGVHFSKENFNDLILKLRSKVDAFAFSGLPPIVRLSGKTYAHHDYMSLMAAPCSIPVCDGYRLKELIEVNELKRLMIEGKLSAQKGVFMPMSLYQTEIFNFLMGIEGAKLQLGDLYSLYGVDNVLDSNSALNQLKPILVTLLSYQSPDKFGLYGMNDRRLLNSERIMRKIMLSDFVISDIGILEMFGPALQFIEGKNLILPFSHPAIEKRIREFNPKSVMTLLPESLKFSPYVNFSVIDAAFRLALGVHSALTLEEWERELKCDVSVLDEVKSHILNSKPSLQMGVAKQVSKIRKKFKKSKNPDFAFIVHPLTQKHLMKIPVFGNIAKLPGDFSVAMTEKLVSKVPGFSYCEVRHVVSEYNDCEVNGLIYVYPQTPKMMMNDDPEVLYANIEKICHHAASKGAKIMGLGAYTKIVGDAGVTINRLSPIPVTTGNSLSASSTLWAAYELLKKMDLVRVMPDGKRFNGTAMVIGATGSIGKVSSKLLSHAFMKLILVATKQDRLVNLKTELETYAPSCEVVITTDANEFATEPDLIITATSAYDQKILDVNLVKPGVVICDCSRPQDFDIEDSKKRPDILIMESGELYLPGTALVTATIGLPKNMVYACLAETALLALEGRFEPFTMGREIELERVKEIYKLAKKHGVKLADIRGHAGMISDREITLIRELSLKRRAEMGI